VRCRVQIVLLGVIVLLLGMFLATAIDQVRLKSGIASCKNNLRSIGMGLYNYAEFKGHFPAATCTNSDLPYDRRLSWMIEIDPFVHARMDADWRPQCQEPWDSETNRKFAVSRMPWYVCPMSLSRSDAAGLGLSSYVGSTGVGADAGTLPRGHPRGGAFNFERGIGFGEFLDTMESVMIIETAAENGPWGAGGRPTARPFEPEGQRPVGRGGQFGGLHRGGVNMMYADTGVFFVRDTVSPDVMASLVTIAGRDISQPLPE
jgi:hypothetical protein